MNKKKIIAVALCVCMAATAIVGGTLAYFTDTDSATNTFTTGNVVIDLIEQERKYDDDGNVTGFQDFSNNKVLYPIVGSAQGEKDKYGMQTAGNYVDKIVTIKNLASDAWVRMYYAVPTALDDKDDDSKDVIHLNLGNRVDFEGESKYNTGDWNPLYKNNVGNETFVGTAKIKEIEYNVYYFDYNKIVTKDEVTAAFLCGVYMDKNVDYVNATVVDNEKVDGYYTLNGKKIDYDFSKGVDIPVFAVGVQSQGFDTCAAAVNAAFGTNFNPWATATAAE